MRPIVRILFGTATALSLVLFAAAVTAWVWSARTAKMAWHQRGNDHYFFAAHDGRLGLGYSAWARGRDGPDGFGFRSYRPGLGIWNLQPEDDTLAYRIGFGIVRKTYPPIVIRSETVVTPIWAIVALTLPLPAARGIASVRRRRRVRQGGSPVCGYDLRATPDCCPECGAVPTTKAARPGGSVEF